MDNTTQTKKPTKREPKWVTGVGAGLLGLSVANLANPDAGIVMAGGALGAILLGVGISIEWRD